MDIGDVIGAYHLDGVIGRGGMGVVYRATQQTLQRVVALKLLAPELAGDETFRLRFVREARIAATIDHPNAVTVYEAGELEGMLFIAMQYVEGPDLRAVIEDDFPLAAQRVATIVAQVASALDAAHERGLVHRDIKPANILIGQGDHVFLTDFGLAKHGAERDPVTQSGMVFGTVDFMSPEQIRGDAVDARTDQYGLGAVLYTALTGQVPFPRDSEVARLFAAVNDPPPAVSALRSDVPAAFDEVVARAMAKLPAERYGTAGELANAVLAAAANAPLPAPRPTPAPELGTTYDPIPIAPTVAPGPPPVAPGPPPELGGETMYPPPPEPSPAATGTYAPYAEPPPAPPVARRRGWFRLPSFLRFWTRGAKAPEPPPVQAVDWPSPVPAVPMPPLAGGVRFQLRDGFSYVHHPVTEGDSVIPLFGNEIAIRALAERIEHSRGGSFLVTGFRGVGKSTIVLRALDDVRSACGQDAIVLDLHLNVARPREPAELLFELIRRLFDALDEKRVLGQLDPEARRRIVMAYQRTLLTLRETRENGRERSRSLSLGLSGMLEPVGPKAELGSKTTDSMATETELLAYTEGDVEQDFMRIVRLIRDGVSPADRTGEPEEHAGGADPLVGKIVVVFDELDKLTDRDGAEAIEALLRNLKNLFTTANVHFVFVAGPELHDSALHDSHRGNSVYDSVFAWQLYVPCIWDAAGVLVGALVPMPGSGARTLGEFVHYLRFKARGVPRLLLKELNEFVTWHDGHAWIELRGPDLARVTFYAEIERVLDAFVRPDGGGDAFGVAIDADRWRIGAYYLTDAILRTMGRSFTAASLLAEGAGGALESVSVDSEKKVAALLEYFTKNEVLEIVHGNDAASTYYEDVPDAQTLIYRLRRDVVAKLRAFARVDERERADLAPAGAASAKQPWADTEVPDGLVGEHYELVRELDRSGMGRVYEARDRRSGQEVAVKILDVPEAASSPAMEARFRRKANIAVGIDHPNIVHTLDTFSDAGTPAVVMELVRGTPLRQLLDQVRLRPAEAVAIALRLLSAMDYLYQQGIVRCDLKPSAVMVDSDLNPVILDLGIAKRLDDGEEAASEAEQRVQTVAGVAVGTPAYAAPEQLAGGDVDVRSDLFAVAAILVEMLTGHPPRGEGDLYVILARAVQQRIDLSELEVSTELMDVLRRALALNPDERFATPAAMSEALAATPEALRIGAPPRAAPAVSPA